MTCSCDYIPLYVGAIFFGLLLASLSIEGNPIHDGTMYLLNQFDTFIYYGVHDPATIPNNLINSPYFYFTIIVIGYWKRRKIINIPFSIYYGIKDRHEQPILTEVAEQWIILGKY